MMFTGIFRFRLPLSGICKTSIGVLMPFPFTSWSLCVIPPDITGLMETVEPIASVILSIIFLGLTLNVWEVIGGVFILLAIVKLSRKPNHKPDSKIK